MVKDKFLYPFSSYSQHQNIVHSANRNLAFNYDRNNASKPQFLNFRLTPHLVVGVRYEHEYSRNANHVNIGISQKFRYSKHTGQVQESLFLTQCEPNDNYPPVM